MRKLQVFPAPTPATSKEDWTKLVREMISRYQRMMRSNPEKGDGTKTFDLTEPMAKRRQKAIVNTMGEIYTRYKAPEGGQRILAEAWRDLTCLLRHMRTWIGSGIFCMRLRSGFLINL